MQQNAPERIDAAPDESGRTLLVMDASCAVCAWGAQLVARRDHGDQFRILPAQSERGRAMFAAHGLDADDPESWLVMEPDGRALMDADAVIAVGRRLSGVWPWLARLGSLLPRRARNPLYRLFARHRYRLFGRADLCSMPSEALRRRLISE
ncbi:MAG: DUF393 domain-containing protein [Pseudomonadota bacterium]